VGFSDDKMMKSILVAPLLLTLSILPACSTTDSKAGAQSAQKGTQALSGTSGDMRRYIGEWRSDCIKEFGTKPDGTVGFASSKTTFHFTSVTGNTAQGRLKVENFSTQDCAGTPLLAEEDVSFSHAGNFPVTGVPGQSPTYSGIADRIAAFITTRSETSTELHIGFLDNFSRFQISPVSYFAPNQIIYTKR
jgi:hypothetical protein